MTVRGSVAVGITLIIGALACQRTEQRAVDSLVDTATSPSNAIDSAKPTAAIDSPRTDLSTTSLPRPPRTPNAPPPKPLSILAPDTARGIVRIVGNDPMTALVLSSSNTDTDVLSLTGAARELLRNVVGAEIVIFGRQTSDQDLIASPRGVPRFIVDSFFVRASDGTPATDGVLEEVSGRYQLRLSNGERKAIVALPDALRRHVGSRLYIVGAVERPSAWGVIVER